MRYAEYLDLEASSDIKHEYLRGEVFAMAGVSPEHAGRVAALGAEIGNELRGRPCRVFDPSLRIRVEAIDLSTYPDLTVICDKLETSAIDPHAAINPTLIAEVLSDSTEAYDRGQKFAYYRRIPSLREYLLVSQVEPRLEAYAKNEAGLWVLREAGRGEQLQLASLEGLSLDVDTIYADPLTAAQP